MSSNLLLALCFGAGMGGVAYAKLGRRVGYGNSQNITVVVLGIAILSAIIAYTILISVS